MARPAVKTQTVRRDELAALGSPRLVKTIENMVGDVSEVLPAASEANAQAAEEARQAADGAQTAAEAAQDDATEALERIAALDMDPAAELPWLRAQLLRLDRRVRALERGGSA